MKKVLPLFLFVLLAFTSCHTEPAVYLLSDSPEEMANNAEKFAKETVKRSRHYSDEDWIMTIDQFANMTKDYVDKKNQMSQEDIFRVDSARLVFTKAVAKNGDERIVSKIKEVFNEMNN